MSAKDAIHDAVRNALVKDGWTITQEPLVIEFGGFYVFPDLAARRFLSADRGDERIAVEVKSFSGKSPIHELQQAIGQFMMYELFIRETDPGRRVVLAVGEDASKEVFSRLAARYVVNELKIPLAVVRVETEEVVSWPIY